ncbi:12442_t:CDS:2 [Funneliformis geosporum]|uniref:12442_t:CDS:1 n=1 Tax=Funneliformis geosporum TaxID=1117311 RepID=A0A9W4WPG8_9GLOM|nr:12442_t:CDS:2 [Funneliformis geosporum]
MKQYKHSLDIVPKNLYLIEAERDLDSENIKNNGNIKLETFSSIKPLSEPVPKEPKVKIKPTEEKNIYRWYILSARGGREEKVMKDIRQKLAEKKEMEQEVNDLKIAKSASKKKVIKGYILGHFHLTPQLVSFLYNIPGVIGFLNHEKKDKKLPSFVSERVIENFFAKIQEKKEVKIAVGDDSKLKVGDLVRITEGIFAGADYEGRIVHLDEKKQKVKIVTESSEVKEFQAAEVVRELNQKNLTDTECFPPNYLKPSNFTAEGAWKVQKALTENIKRHSEENSELEILVHQSAKIEYGEDNFLKREDNKMYLEEYFPSEQ